MCHSFTFTMRPCFYRYTKIIKINYKKSQVFLLDNTVSLSSSFLLLDIKQFIVHPLLFLDNSRRPSPRCLYVTGFAKTRLIAGVRNSSYSPFSSTKQNFVDFLFSSKIKNMMLILYVHTIRILGELYNG